MADTKNRGKSSHAAKHFCSIDQAAAMGEEAVKLARAERISATAELVKAFEGRIAGLESRLDALESARWSVRLRRAWVWVKARIGGIFVRVPVAEEHVKFAGWQKENFAAMTQGAKDAREFLDAIEQPPLSPDSAPAQEATNG